MAGDGGDDLGVGAYVPELVLETPFAFPLDSEGKATLPALLRLISNGSLYNVPVRGATAACMADQIHDMRLWITGTYLSRSLRLRKCADCEAVEVRDVSLDLNIGGSRLDRRPLNRLLGWYYGSRPANRTYIGSR